MSMNAKDRQTCELRDEKVRVKFLANQFSSEAGFNARLIDYRFKAMKDALAGAQSCLELGCSDGRMTRHLVQLFPILTVVDGSSDYINAVRRQFPTVSAVQALFEEYEPEEQYDRVLLCHILEHVADPVGLLKRVQNWVKPGGMLVLSVPNANSLHRQAGVAMGLLGSVTELNDADLRIGHRRVYTADTFCAAVQQAGLFVHETSGVFLKPLSNNQIEEGWSEELMDAYYELGKKYPELCAEILVIAGVPGIGRGTSLC